MNRTKEADRKETFRVAFVYRRVDALSRDDAIALLNKLEKEFRSSTGITMPEEGYGRQDNDEVLRFKRMMLGLTPEQTAEVYCTPRDPWKNVSFDPCDLKLEVLGIKHDLKELRRQVDLMHERLLRVQGLAGDKVAPR